VLLLAATLALAGCTGSGKPSGKPPAQKPAASSSAASSASPPTAPRPPRKEPLTGLPVKGALPTRPVMVVKIDNSESSRPQVGLSRADLVTEELVEGGSTRLAAFFYSRLPPVAGPVRSFRASDIGIVKPARAVLVASGGARPTVRRMAAAHVRTYVEGAPGFYRDSSRQAPYNLFVRMPQLAHTLKRARAPRSYLPWGSAHSLPNGSRVTRIAARFSPAHTTTWQFAKGRYVNVNSFAAAHDAFRPGTVLVLRVRVGTAGYLDPAGNLVPETHFTGTGAALVFHGGRMVRATWSKHGYAARLRLHTKTTGLRLPPGHVWVELVPVNGGSVSVSR
jgi:hypothetical protein